jgi:hypothetical protein
MRRLILSLYETLYGFTGLQFLSLALAVSYITGLNLLSLYQFGIIFQKIFHLTIFQKIFSFPFYFFAIMAILLINLISINPLYSLASEKYLKCNGKIAIYSIVSVLFMFLLFTLKISF